MGCGASKTAVVPLGENDDNEGPTNGNRSSSETFIVPIADPQGLEDISVSARTSQGLAFEVPAHDEDIIKKHPPRRLQRLEEQQLPLPTHEQLEEKQVEAEQRRLQILSQRIQSAKQRQKLKRSLLGEGQANGFLIESMHREPSTVEL